MSFKLVLLFVAVMAGQGPERVLDLTRKAEPEPKPRGDRHFSYRGSCRGETTGRIRSAPSLSVSIERLNSTEYSMGGLLVADLRVTNTGNQAIAFPSVLRHEFGEDEDFAGADAVQAALGISASDAEGREHSLTGTILRGSLSRPGTTQPIAPGESIKIRFPGWIVNTDGPSAPATGDAQLFATLILNDGECRTWQPVNSRRVNIRLKSSS